MEASMRLQQIVLTVALLAIPCYSLKSDTSRVIEGSQLAKVGYAEDMKSMAALMASKPDAVPPQVTDFAAVEKVYRARLSPLVKAYGMGVDGEIDSAFERAKRNQDIKVQKQWIEKDLQRAVYHTALRIMDRIPSDRAALDTTTDLLKCLETVMDRRSKGLNEGTKFKDEVNQAVGKLQNASAEQARAQIKMIKGVLEKVYLLSVLWETRGLKAAQGKSDDSPALKRVEGMIYANVFAPAIRDTAVRRAFLAEWQKSPNDISVESIKADLARGMPQLWKELPDSLKNF
jgi:hypothetical protein